MRPRGEVAFPANTWLKRFKDMRKWYDMTEVQALLEISKTVEPEDLERIVRNVKVGMMTYETKYAEYIFIVDPSYQDELPDNHRLPVR